MQRTQQVKIFTIYRIVRRNESRENASGFQQVALNPVNNKQSDVWNSISISKRGTGEEATQETGTTTGNNSQTMDQSSWYEIFKCHLVSVSKMQNKLAVDHDPIKYQVFSYQLQQGKDFSHGMMMSIRTTLKDIDVFRTELKTLICSQQG